MKLYDSIGPNPRFVRMFLAEKGVEIEKVMVDIRGGENRQAPYLAKNPAGQCPALELDDGSYVAEVTAICEYLDEIYPQPPLIGSTAQERAATRMWTRRVDINIAIPLLDSFRFSTALEFFQQRMHCIPQAADDLRQIALEKLAWLDGLMDGRDYLAGDRYSMADIFLWSMLDFANDIGQPLDASWQNLNAWQARIAERPSAAASKKP